MKTSRVIEVLKIIRENASCDNCLYGYDSMEDCEFFITECPVDKALEAGAKIAKMYLDFRRMMARTKEIFKPVEDEYKKGGDSS